MSKRLLTIAMAVHDDPRGVWATCQFIRRHYPQEVLSKIEFLILDNNPRSPKGVATCTFVRTKFSKEVPANYVSAEPRKGTALRNLLVQAADTEFILMIDSHVHVMGLDQTLDFLEHCCGQSNHDHFSGILVDENNGVIGTHQNPAFRGEMFGTWGIFRQTASLPYCEMDPFEIPMHGCGLMLFRRDSWPGFNVGFEAFGAEEGYIHEKYRLLGRRCWTLPFLLWEHHFGHPGGTNYPITNRAKYWNHLIAFHELGLPIEMVHAYFSRLITAEEAEGVRGRFSSLAQAIPVIPKPPGYTPFLGYPIRINDGPAQESQDYAPYEILKFSHAPY